MEIVEPSFAMREEGVAAAAAPADAGAARTILLYVGTISVALGVTSPPVGLFVIPISFVLKNKLHLSAGGLAAFTLVTGVPAYFGIVFGLVRDRWSPLGLGDRGYFILFGAASAFLYFVSCFVPVSVPMLLAVGTLGVVAYLFLWSGWNGLASSIGRARAMSGQVSAMWNFAGTLTTFAVLALGGVLSDWLETLALSDALRVVFALAAICFASIAALGLWKPAAVFGGLEAERRERHDLVAEMFRLARHWPIYPALAIWCLWNFSPGTGTVLQYYLTDRLHGSDTQWGAYNAIYSLASVPMFAVFGLLARRYPLRPLLWLGAAIGVGQMLPLLFARDASTMVLAAIPVGLLGGIATPAYMDLLIRSCPKGLEGAMMMMAWSLYAISTNLGNVWGTSLYESHGGFVTALIATTLVYVLILPLILVTPKELTASADGEAATA
jgi:MFS family permease